MGVVYKAEDLKLKRAAALKLLSHRALQDKDQKARFLRKAQPPGASIIRTSARFTKWTAPAKRISKPH